LSSGSCDIYLLKDGVRQGSALYSGGWSSSETYKFVTKGGLNVTYDEVFSFEIQLSAGASWSWTSCS